MKLTFRITMLSSIGLGAFLSVFLLITIAQASIAPHSELRNWRISQVDTDTSSSIFFRGNTSIAVDALDRIHLSYASNQELRYAVLSGTTYTTDSGGCTGLTRIGSLLRTTIEKC